MTTFLTFFAAIGAWILLFATTRWVKERRLSAPAAVPTVIAVMALYVVAMYLAGVRF